MSLIELTPEEKLLVEQHRNGYRGKFQTALETMINEHDATLGITWDTVSMYLNDYCKIE